MLTFSSSWIKFYFWHWSDQGLNHSKKSETFWLFLWFLTFFLRIFYFYHDFFICFSLMCFFVNFRDFFFRLFFKGVRYFFEWFTPRMLWERGGEQIFVINAWSILYCVIDIIQFVEINARRWAHSKIARGYCHSRKLYKYSFVQKNHIGKGRILDIYVEHHLNFLFSKIIATWLVRLLTRDHKTIL